MRRRSQTLRYLIPAAAVAALAAACGSGSGGSGTVVASHRGSTGTYLTDDKGRSLYVFSADTGGMSTCSGGCAKEWPHVSATGAPTAAGAVRANLLAASGSQATYDGHPLYYFDGDSVPGDTHGQGLTDFGGTWNLVAPDGSAIVAQASGGSGSSGTSGSSDGAGGGYGYGYGGG